MITPAFGLTATERVLPRLALDFTIASLDSRITFTRSLATATVVNSSGNVVAVAADTPRFDYDPITLICKGLLIEETRTNLVRYSEDYRNTADAGGTRPWVYSTGTSVTPDSTASPSNAVDADLITSSSEGGLYQTVTVTSGTVYTQSHFIKAGTIGQFRLRDDITEISVVYDLSNGTITSSNATSATITLYKNGFYRLTATYTTTTTTANVWLRPTGAGTYYQWGSQMELGAFPTSYIPTTTTSLTRNADVATITGTNFSDFFNAGAGTFFINTNARSGDVLLTAGTYTLSADVTALKKYATTYTADPSATELVFGNGTIQKVSYYKQALTAAELAALRY